MWLFLLYGLAAVWALRTLTTLMLRHRQVTRIRLQQQARRKTAEQNILDVIDQKNEELEQQRAGQEPPKRAA